MCSILCLWSRSALFNAHMPAICLCVSVRLCARIASMLCVALIQELRLARSCTRAHALTRAHAHTHAHTHTHTNTHTHTHIHTHTNACIVPAQLCSGELKCCPDRCVPSVPLNLGPPSAWARRKAARAPMLQSQRCVW